MVGPPPKQQRAAEGGVRFGWEAVASRAGEAALRDKASSAVVQQDAVMSSVFGEARGDGDEARAALLAQVNEAAQKNARLELQSRY